LLQVKGNKTTRGNFFPLLFLQARIDQVLSGIPMRRTPRAYTRSSSEVKVRDMFFSSG
jgi:hypothetical protein